VNWENLSKETPPRLLPYLPATCADGPEFWGDSEVRMEPYTNHVLSLLLFLLVGGKELKLLQNWREKEARVFSAPIPLF
jgi:hypothetical protein